MLLTKKLLNEINGSLSLNAKQEGDFSIELGPPSIDTRKINAGDTFFGIEGETRNGCDFFEQAVENGADVEIRSSVQLGSMLAGFAYNSAILGLAHSISHPLTVHCGLSHGMGNAAVLPHVMRFNSSLVTAKIRNIGLAMGLAVNQLPDDEAVQMTIAAIADLSRRIGIPTLKEAGVSRESFDVVASDALTEISTIFNPRNPKKEDVIRILENAFQ